MKLLLDENVHAAVARWIAAARPRVRTDTVLRSLGAGTSDADIANYADLYGWIVVTENHVHFRGLISRRPATGNQQPRRNAGRISLCCGPHVQARRVEQLFDVIEAEHRRSLRQADKRLIMEVYADWYRVDR